jgi:hypothetical protein
MGRYQRVEVKGLAFAVYTGEAGKSTILNKPRCLRNDQRTKWVFTRTTESRLHETLAG